MGIVNGTVSAVTGAANATTSAVGAVGGAAVGGVVGGVRGVAVGARTGLQRGGHSAPAAALTLAAVGAAGLVEWPVLLAVGGTALVLHELSSRQDHDGASRKSEPRPVAVATRSPESPSTRSPRQDHP